MPKESSSRSKYSHSHSPSNKLCRDLTAQGCDSEHRISHVVVIGIQPQIWQEFVRIGLDQITPVHVVDDKHKQRPDGNSPIQLAHEGHFFAPGPPAAWIEAVRILVCGRRRKVPYSGGVVKN